MDTMTGLPAIIAAQIVGSFALGWYLRGRSNDLGSATAKEQLSLALEALNRLARESESIGDNHNSRLAEVSRELLCIADGDVPPESTAMAQAATRLQTIGQEMRTSLSDLAKEVRGELGIADDEPVGDDAESTDMPARRIVLPVAQTTAHRDPAERSPRGSERFAFEQTIYVAPRLRGRPACRADFRPLLSRDISVSGFSYFAETRPRYDALVVAIDGLDGDRIFVAEVVHATLIDTHYVVGCRFLERLAAVPI